MSNKLGELVKSAKGNDRSIREYSRDSGVDPAIISKMISGKYVPKKPKVLKELTSIQASPRNGITYKILVDAAEYEANYKAGIIAGMAATGAALSMVRGLPMVALGVGATSVALATRRGTSEQEIKADAERAISNLQRFSATALGVIYGRLAQNGISFKLDVVEKDESYESKFDTRLILENQPIEEYIISCIYMTEEEQGEDIWVKNVCKRMLQRFILLSPNRKRKVSIVVNCKVVYEYLLKYKNQLSYRGYMSIIFLDVNTVRVEKEECIACYDEGDGDIPVKLL